MKTISLSIDDDLDAALEAVCSQQRRNKSEVVTGVIRKFVAAQQLKRSLHDPSLIQLYAELAAEDSALAEQGMTDYQELLSISDKA